MFVSDDVIGDVSSSTFLNDNVTNSPLRSSGIVLHFKEYLN